MPAMTNGEKRTGPQRREKISNSHLFFPCPSRTSRIMLLDRGHGLLLQRHSGPRISDMQQAAAVHG